MIIKQPRFSTCFHHQIPKNITTSATVYEKMPNCQEGCTPFGSMGPRGGNSASALILLGHSLLSSPDSRGLNLNGGFKTGNLVYTHHRCEEAGKWDLRPGHFMRKEPEDVGEKCRYLRRNCEATKRRQTCCSGNDYPSARICAQL